MFHRFQNSISEFIAKKLRKLRLRIKITDEGRFTEIFRSNAWNSLESVSGPGSEIAATEDIRRHLPQLIEKLRIRILFDAPCGDYNWMRHISDELNIKYIGGDIVKEIIDTLNRKYASNKTNFMHVNIITDEFPEADLMIVRDCLIHFSFGDSRKFLRNFVRSGVKYIAISNSTKSRKVSNRDKRTGKFHAVDLFSSPYNFPVEVIERFPDRPNNEICVWSRDQIEAILPMFGMTS